VLFRHEFAIYVKFTPAGAEILPEDRKGRGGRSRAIAKKAPNDAGVAFSIEIAERVGLHPAANQQIGDDIGQRPGVLCSVPQCIV
jgi:hypothetical protein